MSNARLDGRPFRRAGAQRGYRGSRKRVRRTRLRGNWSLELWLLVIVILVGVLVLVPLLIQHPPLR
jgi:energy-coupling factor transporter transmembrane protein EcfT